MKLTEPVCFGCGTPVIDEPGVYYCEECTARQLEDAGDELAAFDAFHRWADRQGGVTSS